MPNPANDLYPSTSLFPGPTATTKELGVVVASTGALAANFVRSARTIATSIASVGGVASGVTISPPPPPGLSLTAEASDSLTLTAEASDSLTLEPEDPTVL